MSFEVTYNGDIQYIKVFYSTEKTRSGKYYGEFYKKMDVLASDLKRLKQELDEDEMMDMTFSSGIDEEDDTWQQLSKCVINNIRLNKE